MADAFRPSDSSIELATEVIHEVASAGLPEPDFDLAYGAAVVTNPDDFALLPPGHTHGDPSTRRIFGVTAITLRPGGEASFRTATFGLRDPDVVAAIDELGTTRINAMRARAAAAPRLMASQGSKTMLDEIFRKTQEGHVCTLGGVIMHSVPNARPNEVGAHDFIATPLADYLAARSQTRLGSVGAGLAKVVVSLARGRTFERTGMTSEEATIFANYVGIIAGAVKRDGPVAARYQLGARI